MARLWKTILTAWLAAVPVILFFAETPEVSACSCAKKLSPAEAARLSDAAFAGTVVEISDPNKGRLVRSSADPLHVRFEVARVWKGELGPEAVVTTAMSDASCGYPWFEVGKTYAVFASDAGDGLRTGLCSGNVPLPDDAAEAAVAAELGEGAVVARTGGPDAGAGGAESGGTPGGGRSAAADAAKDRVPPGIAAALAGTAFVLAALTFWILYRNRKK